VINVGVLETNLVEEKIKFKSKAEETDYDVYRATSNYQAQMASLRVQKVATSVDFVVDSPENLNLFQQNLKYLGIEVTPGSHVDQVVKSLILNYQDRKAQGIFKHRWMLWVMKPFVWATLPFKYVGLVD
jgi:hypothetical protein